MQKKSHVFLGSAMVFAAAAVFAMTVVAVGGLKTAFGDTSAYLGNEPANIVAKLSALPAGDLTPCPAWQSSNSTNAASNLTAFDACESIYIAQAQALGYSASCSNIAVAPPSLGTTYAPYCVLSGNGILGQLNDYVDIPYLTVGNGNFSGQGSRWYVLANCAANATCAAQSTPANSFCSLLGGDMKSGANTTVVAGPETNSSAPSFVCPGLGTYSGTSMNGAAGSPTVTLTATANGVTQDNLTVATGTSITYNWSATGATTETSSYIIDNGNAGDACGGGRGAGPWAWTAGTNSGTDTEAVQNCQYGHTYTITYTASNAAGSASKTIYVTVGMPSSATTATTTATSNSSNNSNTSNNSTATNGGAACTGTSATLASLAQAVQGLVGVISSAGNNISASTAASIEAAVNSIAQIIAQLGSAASTGNCATTSSSTNSTTTATTTNATTNTTNSTTAPAGTVYAGGQTAGSAVLSSGPFRYIDIDDMATSSGPGQFGVPVVRSGTWISWGEIELFDANGNPITISPSNITAGISGPGGYLSTAASVAALVDGNPNTFWNSGYYQGNVKIDLGTPIQISKIELLSNNTPDPGGAFTKILVSNDGATYQQAAAFDAANVKTNGQWIIYNASTASWTVAPQGAVPIAIATSTITSCVTNSCGGETYSGLYYFPANNQMVSTYCISQYDQGGSNCQNYPTYIIGGTKYWFRAGGKDTATCMNLAPTTQACVGPALMLPAGTSSTLVSCVANACTGALDPGVYYLPLKNQTISSYCMPQYDYGGSNCQNYPTYSIDGTNYWFRTGGKNTAECPNWATPPAVCTSTH